MFCHGLTSPMLFCLVAVLYEFSGSRRVGLNKGLLVVSPSFVFFLACFSMLNMGFPISLNFISEFILVSRVKIISYYIFFVVGLMCFITGGYCFYMYRIISHGNVRFDLNISRCFNDRYIIRSVLCIIILTFSFLGLDFFF